MLQEFKKARRGGKDPNADAAIKLYMPERCFSFYLSWKAQLPPQVTPCSFSSFMRYRPFNIVFEHKQDCCVCVYHRSMQLRIRTLSKMRKDLHKDKRRRDRNAGKCGHHALCGCECRLCMLDPEADFLDSVMCPRSPGEPHFAISCVFGRCRHCGWDKIQGACPSETEQADVLLPCTFLGSVLRVNGTGSLKKIKAEVTKEMPWGEFLAATKAELYGLVGARHESFLVHDFLARWQGIAYQQLFDILAGDNDSEMWVSDFIENYSCFSQVELQQEFFNRTNISIFIVLVIRKRREDEFIADVGTSYALPDNLCCECHVFLSSDKTHDAGFACYSWEKVAEWEKDQGRLPKHVLHWSDGAPNQFKWAVPMWFLSHFRLKFGFDFVLYSFFASCHGKGMQDAAGAWIKTMVTNFVLIGGVIACLRDFVDYCIEHLVSCAQAPMGKSKTKFTQNRIFHEVSIDSLARYRAFGLPQVKSWSDGGVFSALRSNHCFWATGDEDTIGKRWVVCLCEACRAPRFDFKNSLERERFTLQDEWLNEPFEAKLSATWAKEKTLEEQEKESTEVDLYPCALPRLTDTIACCAVREEAQKEQPCCCACG